jgi:hypothetical protein
MMKEFYRRYKKLLFAVEANLFFSQKAPQKRPINIPGSTFPDRDRIPERDRKPQSLWRAAVARVSGNIDFSAAKLRFKTTQRLAPILFS